MGQVYQSLSGGFLQSNSMLSPLSSGSQKTHRTCFEFGPWTGVATQRAPGQRTYPLLLSVLLQVLFKSISSGARYVIL
jgi:hypothetical protein